MVRPEDPVASVSRSVSTGDASAVAHALHRLRCMPVRLTSVERV
jgi:hypothetical protein